MGHWALRIPGSLQTISKACAQLEPGTWMTWQWTRDPLQDPQTILILLRVLEPSTALPSSPEVTSSSFSYHPLTNKRNCSGKGRPGTQRLFLSAYSLLIILRFDPHIVMESAYIPKIVRLFGRKAWPSPKHTKSKLLNERADQVSVVTTQVA